MGRIQDALQRAEQSRTNRRNQNTHYGRKGRKSRFIRIKHQTGSMRGQEQRLHERSILIGRARHNDVAFDPFEDGTVSAQHAEIRQEADGFVLYDMGSLNGTFVNGFPVRRAALSDGDEVQLGRKGPIFTVSSGIFQLEPAAGPETSPSSPPVDEDLIATQEIPDFDPPSEEKRSTSKVNIALRVLIAAIFIDLAMNVLRMLSE